MKKKITVSTAILWLFAAVFLAGCFTAAAPEPVQAAVPKKFVYQNGSYYYYNSAGKKVKGWYTSPSGVRYYFDSRTGAAKPGIRKLKDRTYCFSNKGKMLTGWQTVKGKRYFFNKKTGCMHTGWLRTASGNMYYFFHDGVIRPGFQTVQGKIRYFNSNGLMIRNKIVTHKGKRYYMDKNGYRKAGLVKIGRNWYAFDRKTGVQLRNAFYTASDGSRYYAGSRYSLVKGFYKVGSYYRYFRPSDHKMVTGWQTIGSHKYLFNTHTGARYDACKVTLVKNMYCFNGNGQMYRNAWAAIKGKIYYAQSNGLLATGWLNLKGNHYFLNSAGERQTGWVTVNKKKYYLSPSTGIMKRNCWIDRTHYVGNDGAWIPNYQEKNFRWPLSSKNNIITSYFGPRKPPGPGASSYHKGIDIAAKSGEPIYAVADGTISLIKHNNGGAGNHIQITHADGIVSEYMHQSKFAPGLKQGSKVKKGQLIGYVGNTGTSFGAHLHLGIIVKGTHKDPLDYVKRPGK